MCLAWKSERNYKPWRYAAVSQAVSKHPDLSGQPPWGRTELWIDLDVMGSAVLLLQTKTELLADAQRKRPITGDDWGRDWSRCWDRDWDGGLKLGPVLGGVDQGWNVMLHYDIKHYDAAQYHTVCYHAVCCHALVYNTMHSDAAQ